MLSKVFFQLWQKPHRKGVRVEVANSTSPPSGTFIVKQHSLYVKLCKKEYDFA